MKKIALIFILIIQYIIIVILGALSYKNSNAVQKVDDENINSYSYYCIKEIESSIEDYKLYQRYNFVVDLDGTITSSSNIMIYEYLDYQTYIAVKSNMQNDSTYKLSFDDKNLTVELLFLDNNDYLNEWYKRISENLISDGYNCNIMIN